MQTRSQYEKEILSHLTYHLERYPAMRHEDIVKLIFQGMFGVGHLLSDRAHVIGYIQTESAALQPDAAEPLLEPLSPCWCRMNLRRALADHISAEQIADLMMSSQSETCFTRQDVYDLCLRMSKEYPLNPEALADILDEHWLPSHSAEYRALYHPAYRVVPTCADSLANR